MSILFKIIAKYPEGNYFLPTDLLTTRWLSIRNSRSKVLRIHNSFTVLMRHNNY